jgi:hypothetical protein
LLILVDLFGNYFEESNPNKAFIEDLFPEFKDYVCPSAQILSRPDFALSFLQSTFESKSQSEILLRKLKSDAPTWNEVIRCIIEKNITATL